MISQALSHYRHLELNLISMGLFATVFIGVFIYTYRKSGRKTYEGVSRLPLAD